MKIRNGFVSNSSTSSFILLVPKDVHEKVMGKLHPYVQEMMKVMENQHKLKDIDFVSFGYITTMDGNTNLEFTELENYKGELLDGVSSASDCLSEYENKLEKTEKGNYLNLEVLI